MNMAKLEFTHGTMSSRKSATALMVAYEYRSINYNVWCLKPDVDTRDGAYIVSRGLGKSIPATLVSSNTNITEIFEKENNAKKIDLIIIDEAQFLTAKQVTQLKSITIYYGVNVFCYGLLTNYITEMFEGSKRLMELADKIIVLDTPCKCGKCIATVNALIVDGKVAKEMIGDSAVEIGDTKKTERYYIAMCYKCWLESK